MHWIWHAVSALAPDTVWTRLSPQARSIYLSFDDGPDPEHTPPVLDLLREHRAKATFFLIGRRALDHPEIVRRILDEGHSVGNHSMTHPRLPKLSRRDQLVEIARGNEVLAAFNGRTAQLFRPPNGRATWTTIAHCLLKRQPLVLWSIDSLDYRLNPEQVAARLKDHSVRHGDILLFHDDGECALKALERLLPLWHDMGLKFATLDHPGGSEHAPATC